jgi:DNA mismatch repair ATPase MutS
MKQKYMLHLTLIIFTDNEQDGHFAYSYRMRPGVNRDSHGLKVAQLAGMPHSAVTVAKEALSWLNKNNPNDTGNAVQLTTLGQSLASPTTQLAIPAS